MAVLLDLKVGGVHGELRWSVGVQHAPSRLRSGGHLLTAQADVVNIQRLTAAEQLSELRSIAAASDGMLCQVLAQQADVHANGFGNNIQGTAHRQYGIQVFNGGIEGEIAVARYAALARQVPLLADEVHEVQKCLVLDHHTLRLARRTGRVDHVRQGLRSGWTQFA